MPGDTVQSLVAGKTAGYDALLSTYAAGATVALRTIERWQGGFHGGQDRKDGA